MSRVAIGRKALRRPPLTVIPARAGMRSEKSSSRCLTCTAGMAGASARTRAAAPETWGVAMEVPLAKA